MSTIRNSDDIIIVKEVEERILKAIQDSSSNTEKKMEGINSEIRNIKNDVTSNSRNIKTLERKNYWGYIVTAVAVLGVYIAMCFVVWAVLKG